MKHGSLICCRNAFKDVERVVCAAEHAAVQAASVHEENGGKTVVRLYPRINTARSSQRRLALCRIIIGHFIDPCAEMLFLDVLHMRVRGRAQLPRSC